MSDEQAPSPDRVDHDPDVEPDVERLALRRRLWAGYREAARRAVAFARAYRTEEGAPGGRREKECILQANAWRAAAREVWSGRLAMPGLARTRIEAPASKREAV